MDPAEIGNNYPVAGGLCGDARLTLADLLAALLQVPELANPDFEQCVIDFRVNGYRVATPLVDFKGSALQIAGSGQLLGATGTYAGTITGSAGTVFDYASSADSTLSGAIGGALAISQTGLGTLTLTGSNAYSGGTTQRNFTLGQTINDRERHSRDLPRTNDCKKRIRPHRWTSSAATHIEL